VLIVIEVISDLLRLKVGHLQLLLAVAICLDHWLEFLTVEKVTFDDKIKIDAVLIVLDDQRVSLQRVLRLEPFERESGHTRFPRVQLPAALLPLAASVADLDKGTSRTVVVSMSPAEFHRRERLSHVDLAVETHFEVNPLRDLTQASELVKAILEHVEVQLHLINVFIECQHIITAAARRDHGASRHSAPAASTSFKERVTNIAGSPSGRIFQSIAVRGDTSSFATCTIYRALGSLIILILGQVDGHFGLLTDLHEHELAHADVVLLGHLPTLV